MNTIDEQIKWLNEQIINDEKAPAGLYAIRNSLYELKELKVEFLEHIGNKRGLLPMRRDVVVDLIVDAVCRFYKVPRYQVQAKKRGKTEISDARHYCFRLLRDFQPSRALREIGEYFGGRDHSTVLHGVNMVQDRLDAYPHEREQFEQLKQLINEKIERIQSQQKEEE